MTQYTVSGLKQVALNKLKHSIHPYHPYYPKLKISDFFAKTTALRVNGEFILCLIRQFIGC